jgi:hypothetical protein
MTIPRRSAAKPRIRQTIYDNWYGYLGTRKVEYFSGTPRNQEEQARRWLESQLKQIRQKNNE